MKKRWLAPLLVVLMCMRLATAGAQTLPSVECFSPGLVRLAQALGGEAAVSVTAEASVEDAFYARDLSVLARMLEGMTFSYEGAGGETDGYDRLSLVRGGKTLLCGGLQSFPNGTELTIEDETFFVPDASFALAALTGCGSLAQGAPESSGPDLTGLSLAERVPLTLVEAWLSGLETGDAFGFGLSIAEPFVLERTMSDDGTRLTKLDFRASLAGESGAPLVIEGFIRQPAGRTPKETAEITVTQDEKNTLEISYSSTRSSNVTRKNREGETRVDSALKVAGKLAGSGISSRLTVRMTNNWTADPDAETLSERVTVTTSLTHQDKRPGMRMLRLNAVEGKLRQTLRLTTSEGDGAASAYTLTDEATVDIQMDGNTFLAGSATLRASVDGGARATASAGTDVATDGEAKAWASAEEIAGAAQRAVEKLAAGLYAQLGEGTREKIEKGL